MKLVIDVPVDWLLNVLFVIRIIISLEVFVLLPVPIDIGRIQLIKNVMVVIIIVRLVNRKMHPTECVHPVFQEDIFIYQLVLLIARLLPEIFIMIM